MVNSSHTSSGATNNDGWGMGFLLILSHHHPSSSDHQQLLPHSSPSSFDKKKPSILRTKSSSLLFSKTQSTLSICVILLFTTILLFALSTFELEPVNKTSGSGLSSRRMLQEGGRKSNKVLSLFSQRLKEKKMKSSESHLAPIAALQGMGALYLRGTKAMTDLVVAHVPEDVNDKEFMSFMRLLLHSGLLSRSDLVFIYASASSAARFGALVKTECDSFLRLVHFGRELGRFTELGSGFSRYLRRVGEGEMKEPIWGRRRVNSSSVGELTRSSYGSVVGFEVSELDPEDTLSGFLDHVPMSLRRWAVYPMLLGRVRRQFKHMMLVDVKSTLILTDPFSRVRNRTSESLVFWSNHDAELPARYHGKKHLGKTRDSNSEPQVNPTVIVGGSRGVRRFATAVLTEIVRGVIEHKGKGRKSVTDTGLVNQLVHNGHLLKSINLITPAEPLADLSSQGRLNPINSGVGPSSSLLKLSDYFSVVQRGGGSGTSFDIDEAVQREICASHKLYSSVYSDCLASQY